MAKNNHAESLKALVKGRSKCVRAVAAVTAARNVWADAREHGSEDEPIYLSPQPYIFWLYRSLRTAWDPIARVWPQLIEVYRRSYHITRLKVNEDDRAFPAVNAWLRAHDSLWSGVCFAEHAVSALDAWSRWDETYVPDLRDFTEDNSDFWEMVDYGQPKELDDLIAKITYARPLKRTTGASFDQVIREPAKLLRPMPLPSDKAKLVPLDEELDKSLVLANAEWEFIQGIPKRRSARQSPNSVAELFTKKFDDWISELWNSGHPLQHFVPPLEFAKCVFICDGAAGKIYRALEPRMPPIQEAELAVLLDAAIESGNQLLGTCLESCAAFRAEIHEADGGGSGGEPTATEAKPATVTVPQQDEVPQKVIEEEGAL